ncbi:MAG: hypothetical protein ACOVO5_00380 [Devosia sp.]
MRGTEFDFLVDPVTGETKVILYGGQTIICAGNDDCVTLSEICGIASTSSQSAQVLGSARGAAGKNGFSYAGNQQPLLQTFRVDGASACAQRRVCPKGGDLAISCRSGRVRSYVQRLAEGDCRDAAAARPHHRGRAQ